ncbi:MAG TPA: hypothetical protein VGW33_13815 [Terriglobia bacterium]|nr:hypothetical protein [Terriglobia bacterium]
MRLRLREPFRVFARGASLRRRVAYSLAIVRLILVPVIVLAVYYLFAMSWIVDRIVNVDAPVATLAEHASIEMMDARRAERNYFLLHDDADLKANRQALADLKDTIEGCRDLQPEDNVTTGKILQQVDLYQQRLEAAVSRSGRPEAPAEQTGQIQQAVAAYEKDLNDLLRQSRHKSRAELVNELHTRVGSFDAEMAQTLEARDPSLRQTIAGLQASSGAVIELSAELEKQSWDRVRRDHVEARQLKRRAEWVLSIVSVLVFLLSVWVSFVLPREVVKPLVDLKTAVDHAAAGNYEIEFDVEGEGEVVQLADAVRNLIAHVREKTMSFAGRR